MFGDLEKSEINAEKIQINHETEQREITKLFMWNCIFNFNLIDNKIYFKIKAGDQHLQASRRSKK